MAHVAHHPRLGANRCRQDDRCTSAIPTSHSRRSDLDGRSSGGVSTRGVSVSVSIAGQDASTAAGTVHHPARRVVPARLSTVIRVGHPTGRAIPMSRVRGKASETGRVEKVVEESIFL
jgi:hypothetical protein